MSLRFRVASLTSPSGCNLGPNSKHPKVTQSAYLTLLSHTYLLANKESLQERQQLGFQHGDAAFRKDVEAAYSDTYTFDKYCTLM